MHLVEFALLNSTSNVKLFPICQFEPPSQAVELSPESIPAGFDNQDFPDSGNQPDIPELYKPEKHTKTNIPDPDSELLELFAALPHLPPIYGPKDSTQQSPPPPDFR